MNRRSLLKGIAAAPAALSGAAQELQQRLTGVGVNGVGVSSDPSVGYIDSSRKSVYEQLQRLLIEGGMPSWAKERTWLEAQQVYALDTDLAAMRSFSHAAKVQTQRQRNYERLLEIKRTKIQMSWEMSDWEELTGLNAYLLDP